MFDLFPFTLLDSVPFFSFVETDYWPVMSALAFVVLVALGFDGLGRPPALPPPALVVVTIALSAFGYLWFELGFPAAGMARQSVFAFLGIVGFAVSCLVAIRVMPQRTALLKSLLLVGVVVEGLFYMNTLHPQRSKRDHRLTPTLAWVTKELAAPSGPRLLNAGRRSIFPNWGAALQVGELGTLSLAGSAEYRELFRRHIGSGIFSSLSDDDREPTFSPESLSLLGVRYIVVDRAMASTLAKVRSFDYPVVQRDAVRVVFENPAPLPRAFAVPTLVRSDRLPHELAHSPRTAATTIDSQLLTEATALGISSIEPRCNPGTVAITAYHHDTVRLDAALPCPAVVVLMDAWHPNWRATVAERPVYIGRVNMAFRGVALPAGHHVIDLRYRPRTLWLGTILSWAGWAAAFLLLALDRRPA